MDHRAFRELAAGALLDDLEPSEAVGLADHLAACAPCRSDADELAEVAGILALAAPPRRPPATLKSEVLAAIAVPDIPSRPIFDDARRPRLTSVSFGEPIDLAAAAAVRASTRRWRAAGLIGMAAAVLLAVAAGSLLVENRALDGRLATASAQRDATVTQLAKNTAAMNVVLAPDHASAALHPEPLAPGAIAYVVYRPGTGNAWLMASGLPATPAGSVYQLWAADAAGAHPGPTFTCDGTDPCLASFGMDLRGMTAAMVTLEAAGGSVTNAPGPQVVFGDL
jgi:hypothetical protein